MGEQLYVTKPCLRSIEAAQACTIFAQRKTFMDIIKHCCVLNRPRPGLGEMAANLVKLRYALIGGMQALLMGTSSQQLQECQQ